MHFTLKPLVESCNQPLNSDEPQLRVLGARVMVEIALNLEPQIVSLISEFPKKGYLIWCPFYKEPTIYGTMLLGSPYVRKLPYTLINPKPYTLNPKSPKSYDPKPYKPKP